MNVEQTQRRPLPPDALEMARRIVDVRAWTGLRQPGFAEKIGVSRSYLSTVERGESRANLDIVLGIARALPAVSLRWLVTGVGEMLEPERAQIHTDWFLDIARCVTEGEPRHRVITGNWPAVRGGSYLVSLIYNRLCGLRTWSAGEAQRAERELLELHNRGALESHKRELRRADLTDSDRSALEMLSHPLEARFGADAPWPFADTVPAPGNEVEKVFVEDLVREYFKAP